MSWEFLTENWQIFGTLVVLGAAALIQSAVGFAAALFGLPLLLWIGNNLMVSQILIITAMLPQNLSSVWKLRDSLQAREVVLPATIRILAMPLGVVALTYVLTWPTERINQFVGIIILGAIVMQSFVGITWKSATKWYWMLATFGGSGILQGASGMSGPPMVLWVHGQRFTANRARAFLFTMYISNFLPQILLLWWKFGNIVWQTMGLAVLSLPLVLLGAAAGHSLGNRIGDQRLRPISYACLVALGLYSVLAPFLRNL